MRFKLGQQDNRNIILCLFKISSALCHFTFFSFMNFYENLQHLVDFTFWLNRMFFISVSCHFFLRVLFDVGPFSLSMLWRWSVEVLTTFCNWACSSDDEKFGTKHLSQLAFIITTLFPLETEKISSVLVLSVTAYFVHLLFWAFILFWARSMDVLCIYTICLFLFL